MQPPSGGFPAELYLPRHSMPGSVLRRKAWSPTADRVMPYGLLGNGAGAGSVSVAGA
jgi:hypothetical protein